ALGLAGMAIAWAIYGVRRAAVPRLPAAQRLFERKFYFDELYDALFYRPADLIARLLGRFVERPLIAGSVDEVAQGTRDLGQGFARVQTGLLRTYALAI